MAKVVAKHLSDLQPDDAYIWFLRAVVYLGLTEPEQAESCLLRSREISGKIDAWDCQKMSCVRQLQGDLNEAVKWCDRAIELNPDEAYFRWHLIEILYDAW